MKRIACGAIAFALMPGSQLHAQTSKINDLKGKIFDARMAQKTFVNGLKFCKELDGSTFFFEPRNRVLNLQEYHQSLENLAREGVFNPETRRPWNEQDASARWLQVQQEAVRDKYNCELVASLPQLEKQLAELEQTDPARKQTDPAPK